jgi:hypothetical protein
LVNDTIIFPLVPSDSLFTDTLYRPVENFLPSPGEKYRLTCHLNGIPDAIGETIVPAKPEIKENSLIINDQKIQFTLNADSSIKMIDVYLIETNTDHFVSRIIPSEGSDTDVVIDLPESLQGKKLKLFGYDSHLAAYYGNSNTSLNFNKYRTTISTLESGFGVFGSLNFTVIDLDQIK